MKRIIKHLLHTFVVKHLSLSELGWEFSKRELDLDPTNPTLTALSNRDGIYWYEFLLIQLDHMDPGSDALTREWLLDRIGDLRFMLQNRYIICNKGILDGMHRLVVDRLEDKLLMVLERHKDGLAPTLIGKEIDAKNYPHFIIIWIKAKAAHYGKECPIVRLKQPLKKKLKKARHRYILRKHAERIRPDYSLLLRFLVDCSTKPRSLRGFFIKHRGKDSQYSHKHVKVLGEEGFVERTGGTTHAKFSLTHKGKKALKQYMVNRELPDNLFKLIFEEI